MDAIATTHAMSLTWPERIENYRRLIGTPYLVHEERLDPPAPGSWATATGRRPTTMAYQGNFLKRVDAALFPDRPGDTLDISPQRNPTYCCDAETCEGVPLADYDFVLGDPPYSESDAEHYGAPMVSRNKVIRALSAGLRPGARIAWFDQVSPMYSKTLLKPEALIGISGSANHRFRVLTVFRRLGEAEDCPQVPAGQSAVPSQSGRKKGLLYRAPILHDPLSALTGLARTLVRAKLLGRARTRSEDKDR
jgi:hypothetical protein